MTGRAERVSVVGRVASRFASSADVWLAVRMGAWALVLPVMKHLVQVKSLARLMQRPPRLDRRDPVREERIVTFARWAARLVRWRSGGNCLERGLIAYRYLGDAGAQPTLVVGLGHEDGGQMIGHAWVLVDGHPAGESAASLQVYTPVFAFTPDGQLTEVPVAEGERP